MMKSFYQKPGEDLVEAFHRMLETDTGKKIFTLRILEDHNDPDLGIEMLVVFDDKSILKGNLAFPDVFGSLALRMKANWL